MPLPTTDACCLVLAAGKGRRMGGPKALMHVRGRPWWRLQLERLHAAGLESLWVTSPEVSHAWVREAEAPLRVTTEDSPESSPDPSSETPPMFVSLMLGLASVRPLPLVLFVLPVDVPCPTITTMQALRDATDSGVSIPTHAGKSGHPIALSRSWIESRLLPPARHDARTARLDHLVRDSARMLEVSDPSVIVNLNTPTDLEAWLDS